MDATSFRRRYRTLFISDVHLGTRGCQAEALLHFLDTVEFDTLYIVGDLIDGWKLKKGWFFPKAHAAVLQRLLGLARAGVAVTYVPGNHDEFARGFCGLHHAGVQVVSETVHTAADGRRYLVAHGDLYDGVAEKPRWLAWVGDLAYEAMLSVSAACIGLQRRFGLAYWSLADVLKAEAPPAAAFIAGFEQAMAQEARDRGLDGVICGHIHKAAVREIDGVAYVNDGDWVESCTAAVEHPDGRIEVIDWARLSHVVAPLEVEVEVEVGAAQPAFA